MLEDALWLGNDARDSEPPRYGEAERAYRLAARLAPKDPVGLGNIFWYQNERAQLECSYGRLRGGHEEHVAGQPPRGALVRAGRRGLIPELVAVPVAPPHLLIVERDRADVQRRQRVQLARPALRVVYAFVIGLHREA